MPYNQYTSDRKPDIPRPDHDDIVEMIYTKMVVDKMTTAQVVHWLTDTSGYNYGRSYAYDLIKDTKDYKRELILKLNKHTLEDCLAELYSDREQALARGEHRLAFDIQKEIDKIAGHYKERIEINQDVTFKVRFGTSE